MSWEKTPYDFVEGYDLSKQPAWFLERAHTVGFFPFTADRHSRAVTHGMCYGCQILSYPTCKGWLWRVKDAAVYISPIIVTDVEEIKKRGALYREAVRPFIDDFNGLWNKFKTEMETAWDKFDAIDVTKLSDIELINHWLALLFHDLRVWEIHFYFMYAVAGFYCDFEKVAKEAIGLSDMDADFHKLMSGYSNRIFDCDEWMWKLGRRAYELGLGNDILNSRPEEVVHKLRGTENGDKWLAELDDFLKIFGKRMKRLMCFEFSTWEEDPAAPMSRIQALIRKGEDFDLHKLRIKAVKERIETEKVILEKFPYEQRDWVKTLLFTAQNVGWWSEEHEYWLNDHSDSLIRYCMLEMGRRFVKAGSLDKPDDIFYLVQDEIDRLCYAPESYDMRSFIAARKDEYEVCIKKEMPPVITNLDFEGAFGWVMQSNDPILLKIVVGTLPTATKEDLKADLVGVCGSPGVAEGPARVVMSEDQLGEIRPGDILVAPTTIVTWTPVFSIISGVVTDSGGSLAHAAIVAREWGIPCVINTFVGSSIIKTGQRIRVDGDKGAVFFLDK